MAKIRVFNFFDSFAIKKMSSLIKEDATLFSKRSLVMFPIFLLHRACPLLWKFLPEAYVGLENKKITGLISLKPNKGNWRKWKISRLFLNENAHFLGRQLVDYVISTYGAKGVDTFIVNVDSEQNEVLELFAKGCGFKFCSFEQLWLMKSIRVNGVLPENINIRFFKNSDKKEVCNIYNDGIYAQFRNSLCKSPNEFYEALLKCFEKNTSYKYVVEDKITGKISGLITIKTSDNFNYIIELTLSSGYDFFNELITFASLQISKRQKNFRLFIINKKYKQNSTLFENYLNENDFELKQNQAVLVKDYFKRIYNTEKNLADTIFFTNIKGKPAFKTIE